MAELEDLRDQVRALTAENSRLRLTQGPYQHLQAIVRPYGLRIEKYSIETSGSSRHFDVTVTFSGDQLNADLHTLREFFEHKG